MSAPQKENSGARTVEELTRRNVGSVQEIQKAAEAVRTPGERISEAIAGFCGSFRFFLVHVVWFGTWILWNLLPGTRHFDSFPFTFLTLIVSLEAIFLSAFILNSENLAKRHADRRDHLDLQINLLAEQENTKMLVLAGRIAQRLGVYHEDEPSLAVLTAETRPESLAAQIEAAEKNSRP